MWHHIERECCFCLLLWPAWIFVAVLTHGIKLVCLYVSYTWSRSFQEMCTPRIPVSRHSNVIVNVFSAAPQVKSLDVLPHDSDYYVAQCCRLTSTSHCRFVLGRPLVASAIVGATSRSQLAELIEASRRGPLPQELLSAIDGIHEECPNPAPWAKI